ncbi:MAG: DUF3048 domain-containing protein [Candidatus Nanopelagicales bacterium]
MKKLRTMLASLLSLLIVASVGVSAATANDSSPLSGLAGGKGQPVVMVKIDNVGPARPHTGLYKADLVYVYQVEGGLSRIAAMYNSNFPRVVGPVRSARLSDLDILRQYGNPGLVFSGANRVLIKRINAAKSWVPMGPSQTRGMFRTRAKRVPHNLMINLNQAVRKKRGIGKVQDIGLTFNSANPNGGRSTSSFRAKWPAASVSGTWTGSGYRIALDGKPQSDGANGTPLVAKTVVIQSIRQVAGKTPRVHTVGSGKAVILRNGKRYQGTWQRDRLKGGTTYFVDGKPFSVDVGQVWVLLVDQKKKRAVTFG